MSPGSSWTRGATPAASLGPVGVGVTGCAGFGVGPGEWTRDEAATRWDLLNGNVCATVAAIRYPPISATAVTPAISPRFRPDHEFLGPPEDGWGGGQDCPGGGPAGGQDCGGAPAGGQDCGGGPAGGQDCGEGPPAAQGCCGSAGCQNWPGGRCGAGPAGGQDCGLGAWMAGAPAAGGTVAGAPAAGGTVAGAPAAGGRAVVVGAARSSSCGCLGGTAGVYGRTWYPR